MLEKAAQPTTENMSEFEIIRRYFTRSTKKTILGVGDDAALIKPPSAMMLAISTDTLVSGVHFFPTTDPFKLGHKALAVNLSDMAAMGAQPRWALLGLTLPKINKNWLKQFSKGFFNLAKKYDVALIGGDTTRGPLNINLTILGVVPKNVALYRTGSKPGDEIWISGYLGEAALGLNHLKKKIKLQNQDLSRCLAALTIPQPRVALGIKLRGIAHSAIDISDGLLADLSHILKASGVSAVIEFAKLPLSTPLRNHLNKKLTMHCLLAGGDDYELCFTAPHSHRSKITRIAKQLRLPLTCIGKITPGKNASIQLLDSQGKQISFTHKGFDHFG